MRESLATLLQSLQKRVSRNGRANAFHPLFLLLQRVRLDAVVGVVAHNDSTIGHRLASLDRGATNLLVQADLKDVLNTTGTAVTKCL